MILLIVFFRNNLYWSSSLQQPVLWYGDSSKRADELVKVLAIRCVTDLSMINDADAEAEAVLTAEQLMQGFWAYSNTAASAAAAAAAATAFPGSGPQHHLNLTATSNLMTISGVVPTQMKKSISVKELFPLLFPIPTFTVPDNLSSPSKTPLKQHLPLGSPASAAFSSMSYEGIRGDSIDGGNGEEVRSDGTSSHCGQDSDNVESSTAVRNELLLSSTSGGGSEAEGAIKREQTKDQSSAVAAPVSSGSGAAASDSISTTRGGVNMELEDATAPSLSVTTESFSTASAASLPPSAINSTNRTEGGAMLRPLTPSSGNRHNLDKSKNIGDSGNINGISNFLSVSMPPSFPTSDGSPITKQVPCTLPLLNVL
jgi:hypothetical protein